MPRQYVTLPIPEPVTLSAKYPRHVDKMAMQVVVSSWPREFTAKETAALTAAGYSITDVASARTTIQAWDWAWIDANPAVKNGIDGK